MRQGVHPRRFGTAGGPGAAARAVAGGGLVTLVAANETVRLRLQGLPLEPDESDLPTVVLRHPRERRGFFFARHTPGRPEIEDDEMPAQLAQVESTVEAWSK